MQRLIQIIFGNRFTLTTVLAALIGVPITAPAAANDLSTSFEGFVDIDGQFTLGESPNSVTFMNGEVKTVGDLSLYRPDGGVQSFMVDENETATIVFETPAAELSLWLKREFGLSATLRLLDTEGAEIEAVEATTSFVEITHSQMETGVAVGSIEMVNNGPDGYTVIDQFSFCAVQRAAPTLDQVLHFAQFGNGGGLFSQIQLVNQTGTESLVRVELFDDDGNPLMVNLNGAPVDGQTEFMIPPAGLRVLLSDGEGNVVAGSVTVRSEQRLSGIIVFGGVVGLAGVGASDSMSASFTAPIEARTAEGINTGIALQNLRDGMNTVQLELLDPEGQVVATASETLPDFGHSAQFVTEIEWDAEIGFEDFQGVLRGIPDEDVAATAIQSRIVETDSGPQNQFASLPVDEEDSSDSN